MLLNKRPATTLAEFNCRSADHSANDECPGFV
jgi:hypothetical protein